MVFKFELEQSVNISMFQTDENHHRVSDSIQVRKRVLPHTIKKTLNMFILLYHSQLMFKFINHTTFQKIKKGILDKISKLTLIKT